MLNVVIVSNWPYWRLQIIKQISKSRHKISSVYIPSFSNKKIILLLLKLFSRIPRCGYFADLVKHGINSELVDLHKFAFREKFFVKQVSDINRKNVIEEIKKTKPDVILTLAWPKKFLPELLDIPVLGCINCHPSILPKYRGRFPISAAIMANDKKTGITYHFMNEKYDMGEILYQEEFAITSAETGQTLLNKSGEAFTRSVMPFLERLESGKIKPVQQNENDASTAPHFGRGDSQINWGKTTDEIDRGIRALFPWFRAHTYHHAHKIVVDAYERQVPQQSYQAGKIIQNSKEGILVATRDACLLIKSCSIVGLAKRKANRYIKKHIKAGDILGPKSLKSC